MQTEQVYNALKKVLQHQYIPKDELDFLKDEKLINIISSEKFESNQKRISEKYNLKAKSDVIRKEILDLEQKILEINSKGFFSKIFSDKNLDRTTLSSLNSKIDSKKLKLGQILSQVKKITALSQIFQDFYQSGSVYIAKNNKTTEIVRLITPRLSQRKEDDFDSLLKEIDFTYNLMNNKIHKFDKLIREVSKKDQSITIYDQRSKRFFLRLSFQEKDYSNLMEKYFITNDLLNKRFSLGSYGKAKLPIIMRHIRSELSDVDLFELIENIDGLLKDSKYKYDLLSNHYERILAAYKIKDFNGSPDEKVKTFYNNIEALKDVSLPKTIILKFASKIAYDSSETSKQTNYLAQIKYHINTFKPDAWKLAYSLLRLGGEPDEVVKINDSTRRYLINNQVPIFDKYSHIPARIASLNENLEIKALIFHDAIDMFHESGYSDLDLGLMLLENIVKIPYKNSDLEKKAVWKQFFIYFFKDAFIKP